MTDNEIIKALEHIEAFTCCKDCAFYKKCTGKCVITETLNLINRQKAEIERLNSQKEVVVPSMRLIDGNLLNGFNVESNLFVARTVEDVKAEAYKECIEKVKIEAENATCVYDPDRPQADNMVYHISNIRLDNLLKELVGENDEKI